MSPCQSSLGADILVELETCVGPLIHSRARSCGPVSHSRHQTHAIYLEHLMIDETKYDKSALKLCRQLCCIIFSTASKAKYVIA